MTFFEGITLMIGFGTLIVSILALSYSFTQKNNCPEGQLYYATDRQASAHFLQASAHAWQ